MTITCTVSIPNEKSEEEMVVILPAHLVIMFGIFMTKPLTSIVLFTLFFLFFCFMIVMVFIIGVLIIFKESQK